MNELPSQQGNSPLIQLLAKALQLWIRSRCKSVGELTVDLQGSSKDLLQGKIQGATVEARDVNFQGLIIQHAEIKSGLIQVNINIGWPAKAIQLNEAFSIFGNITMTGKELNQSLLSDQWRWLGDHLSEELMGLAPLGGLRIDNDVLELQAPVIGDNEPARQRFSLSAEDGTLRISHLVGGKETNLPMDPAINIEKGVLASGMLSLCGNAKVSP